MAKNSSAAARKSALSYLSVKCFSSVAIPTAMVAATSEMRSTCSPFCSWADFVPVWTLATVTMTVRSISPMPSANWVSSSAVAHPHLLPTRSADPIRHRIISTASPSRPVSSCKETSINGRTLLHCLTPISIRWILCRARLALSSQHIFCEEVAACTPSLFGLCTVCFF